MDFENCKDSIVVNYVSVDKKFTKNLPNVGSKKRLNKKWCYYFENTPLQLGNNILKLLIFI